MKLSQIAVSLFLMLGLSLAACAGAETAPSPTPTAEAVSIATAATTEPTTEPAAEPAVAEAETPTSVPTVTPSPTLEPTPTNTATTTPTDTPVPPTDTPVPTATPEPSVKIDKALDSTVNVRSGPGTNYPVIGRFEPGQEAVVTGRNDGTSWWQINLADSKTLGWIFAELVTFSGDTEAIAVAEAPPPPPTATPAPQVVAEAAPAEAAPNQEAPAEPEADVDEPETPDELANRLRCGKDFCVTFQDMVPIWENGGCIGNHSIYVTVLEGPPPGKPVDGIVVGDTFNNVEVATGSKGPGTAEITLWMNSMTLKVKRHIDGTPYTSEESFNFTSHDELIPAEVLAAKGYCEGSVEKCRAAQQQNQVCRGHYSWRVTFHKFD